jgi:hypothetical protein
MFNEKDKNPTGEHGKRVLYLTINGKQYEWHQQYITGADIRRLGNISQEDEIFLGVKKPWENEPIPDDKQVDLARPEIEHFYSKDKYYNIVVDKLQIKVRQECLTGKEILILAGKNPPERFQLNQRFKDGKVVKVGYDQKVCFTKPGIEKFMTIPLDQTEG